MQCDTQKALFLALPLVVGSLLLGAQPAHFAVGGIACDTDGDCLTQLPGKPACEHCIYERLVEADDQVDYWFGVDCGSETATWTCPPEATTVLATNDVGTVCFFSDDEHASGCGQISDAQDDEGDPITYEVYYKLYECGDLDNECDFVRSEPDVRTLKECAFCD